ncbi:ADP-ribosylation factor-binding protein GGA3-like isoform X2 [Genypterus blacodes]
MKSCGQRFHNEVGKFRFLNELIKVVSPKYFGDKISEQVKTKVIEMVYSWTVSLPDETKISEAYQMLKAQGIVSVDPELPPDTLTPSPPRPKNPVFDDENKGKRLKELLKSKKPEDLQEANRLIKNMVKEDEVRTKRVTRQKSTLEEVDNSVKVLNEMLAHFSADESTDGDKELIKELYGDCDKLRQTVFQLATESEDNDTSLGDILQASDDLSHAINAYKKIVEEQTVNGETADTPTRSPGKRGSQPPSSTKESEILIDLMGLDLQSPSPAGQQPPKPSLSIPADLLCVSHTPDAPPAGLSLLDEELLYLGLKEPVPVPTVPKHETLSSHFTSFQDSTQDLNLFGSSPPQIPAFSAPSLFTEALFGAGSPVVPLQSSTAASASLFPELALPAPAASTISASSSVTAPRPLLSAAAPPGLHHSYSAAPSSLSTPARLTNPFIQHQGSFTAGASSSASASLQNNLQDLAMLDLGSPKNSLGRMDFDSLLSKSGSAPLPSSLGASSSSSSSGPLSGGILAGSTPTPPLSLADDSPLLRSLSPVLPLSQGSPAKEQDVSLANVFVPLDAIKPSKMCPVTAYDKDGVRVLLHFASDCPPGRPDVLVMVASMLNTAPLPITNVALQAAVPKLMKVRLQAPSGTELTPFNPILPPAAITQVMLLANPLKEKVRMKYKLTFTLGERLCAEAGELDQFPPADRWGAL